jgi:hypothetical protein
MDGPERLARDRRTRPGAGGDPPAAVDGPPLDITAITSPTLLAELAARADDGRAPGELAERDLARHYRALREELARVELSEAEARLAVEGVVALRAAREEGRPFADLAEAVGAEYLRLRGITGYGWPDGDGLVARLGALCPAATVALVDAGERALILRGSDGPEYRAGGERWLLRAVGLVRE